MKIERSKEWWLAKARAEGDSEVGAGSLWPLCPHCGKPATCIGIYEHPSNPLDYACDTCCGHGCEDGHCDRLPGAPDPPSRG